MTSKYTSTEFQVPVSIQEASKFSKKVSREIISFEFTSLWEQRYYKKLDNLHGKALNPCKNCSFTSISTHK